jgi:hypothetical protein
MIATIVLMTTLTAADGPGPHVRSSVPRLAALLTRGVECSSTVRHLVATLDASDVIVYIEPKQRRPSLSGYLSHHIVTVAGIRYLRIYVEMQGAERQLISLIGHELQHAVEVAQAAELARVRTSSASSTAWASRWGATPPTAMRLVRPGTSNARYGGNCTRPAPRAIEIAMRLLATRPVAYAPTR